MKIASRRPASPATWLLAVLVVSGLALSGLAAETPPLGTLRKARQMFQSGQSRAAEALVRQILADKSAALEAGPAAGCWELLTAIYRESGRYDDALSAGLHYQQLLQSPGSEAGVVAQRQEIAVSLAEIYAAQLRYPEAAKSLELALSLPGGLRSADPLWEARVHAIQARTAQSRGDKSAAQTYWRQTESQARDVMARFQRRAVDHNTGVAALRLLSQSLSEANRPQDAIAALDKLRSLEQNDDLATAETLREIANCYAQLHDAGREKQALLDALAVLERQEKQRATDDYADLLDRLASVCQSQRDDAEAQQYWNRSAELFETLSNEAQADTADEIKQCQNLQRVYQRLGRWQDGIRVTERLLEYRQQTMLPDDPEIWRAKSALGGFYSKLDDMARARPLLEEALGYWRGRQPPAVTELAGALNNLAEVARASGAYNEAFEHLEEALPLYERLYAADDFRLAELHSNLAAVLSAKGRYKAAIDHYRATAKVCRASAGKDRHADELLATTLLNTAMLYKSQRQFTEAADNCLEALEIRRRLTPDDEKSLLPFYLAIASLHLAQDQAQPAVERGASIDLLEAEKFITEARNSCVRLRQLDKPNGGTVHQLEGMVQLRQGQLNRAAESFHASLSIAKNSRQIAAEAKSLTYLAEIELRHGIAADAASRTASFEQAEQLSREALDLHRQVQAYPNLQFMAFLSYARAARALGHGPTAMRALDVAVRLIESPRAATVGAESERAEFFSQFVMAFDLLVDWNVADDRLADALTAAEMGRNRTFVDQLRAAGIDLRESLAGGPHEELLHRERDVLTRYHQLLTELRRTYAEAGPRDQIARDSQQIDELRKEYSRIQRDIRDASPAYRHLLGEHHQGHTWPQIAPHILAPDNAVLLYYLGHSKSHAFLVDGRTGAIEHFDLQISAEQAPQLGLRPGAVTRAVAAQLVNDYLALLRTVKPAGKRGLTLENDVVPLNPTQQVALGQVFLPPKLRDRVGELQPEYLVVVPDGALDQLPLEALLVDDAPTRYLLDDFPAIAYAPSATILSLLRQRQPGNDAPLSLLTVGDPHYAGASNAQQRAGTATIAEYHAFGGQLNPLPATLEECDRVKKAIAACSATADIVELTGAAATEKNVRQNISNRRFIHFAAHALVDQRHENLFGAIALTPPPAGSPPADGDGFLSLYEIHNLTLTDCELAVLSACDTNVGSNRPLEAGSTLARAFLAAGTRAVVSSHWSVEDISTAQLISEFFDRLAVDLRSARPAHYAQALREARRHVRRQAAWEAPHYWAPFVLIGPASAQQSNVAAAAATAPTKVGSDDH